MLSKKLIKVSAIHVLNNEGAKTAGIDGVNKSFFKTKQNFDKIIDEIYAELKDKKYKPQAVRRVYIPKSNGKKRPLGIPTIKDRIVQEMLRILLEPIYECKFCKHSYGFRPYRSTHHAAVRIRDLIGRRGYRWVVEGDLTKCFDNINHITLINILAKDIKDNFVLYLIKDFLKSGIMEDNQFFINDAGTPQGGIVSPLLANIYLDRLDKEVMNWYEEQKQSTKSEYRNGVLNRKRFIGNIPKSEYEIINLLWNQPKGAKDIQNARNTGASTTCTQLKGLIEKELVERIPGNKPYKYIATNKGKRTWTEANREEKSRQEIIPCYIVRYADDFVVVTDTESNALNLKKRIKEFLCKKLYLELNEDKTHITEVSEGFDFLGFNIKLYTKNAQSICLIKPSGDKIKAFKRTIKEFSEMAWAQENKSGMICRLNQIINGWGNYYSPVSSTRTFKKLDHYIWHRVFEDTWKNRSTGRKRISRRNHYLNNYISYNLDITGYHNWRKGKNYGRYANDDKTRAYIVTKLSFLKICYVNLHPQLNPYIPIERNELMKDRRLNKLLKDVKRRLPQFSAIYGEQWALVRINKYLEFDGKCASCGKKLINEKNLWEFDTHHIKKFNKMQKKEKQNYLNRLEPLCRKCHNKITFNT